MTESCSRTLYEARATHPTYRRPRCPLVSLRPTKLRTTPGMQHGVPTQEKLLARYAELTQTPFPDPYWHYYEAFHAFKVGATAPGAGDVAAGDQVVRTNATQTWDISSERPQAAVIAQGIGMRLRMGTHSSDLAAMYAALTPGLADAAASSLDHLEAALAQASTAAAPLPPPQPELIGPIELADDFTHRPTADATFAEVFYVHIVCTRTRWAGWLRCNNQPAQGHAEVTVVLFRPTGGVLFSFRFRRRRKEAPACGMAAVARTDRSRRAGGMRGTTYGVAPPPPPAAHPSSPTKDGKPAV